MSLSARSILVFCISTSSSLIFSCMLIACMSPTSWEIMASRDRARSGRNSGVGLTDLVIGKTAGGGSLNAGQRTLLASRGERSSWTARGELASVAYEGGIGTGPGRLGSKRA